MNRVMPVSPPWGSTTVRRAEISTEPASRPPATTATQSPAVTGASMAERRPPPGEAWGIIPG